MSTLQPKEGDKEGGEGPTSTPVVIQYNKVQFPIVRYTFPSMLHSVYIHIYFSTPIAHFVRHAHRSYHNCVLMHVSRGKPAFNHHYPPSPTAVVYGRTHL